MRQQSLKQPQTLLSFAVYTSRAQQQRVAGPSTTALTLPRLAITSSDALVCGMQVRCARHHLCCQRDADMVRWRSGMPEAGKWWREPPWNRRTSKWQTQKHAGTLRCAANPIYNVCMTFLMHVNGFLAWLALLADLA